MNTGSLNIDKQVHTYADPLPNYNYMLGRTLNEPFKTSNSGSRATMFCVHIEHIMVPSHGEVPLVMTGYETEFGERSTSFVQADADYVVLKKIFKFSFNPNHYYLIIQNLKTKEYGYIERVTYKHTTESYGFMWDNTRLDNMQEGYIIQQGETIKTSRGFDEFGNKINGTNLTTLYLACAQNMEDSVIISDEAAKKLEANLIKNTPITINENDILLNLYGNDTIYKSFPDIGEAVQNGIFCSIRRVENKDILFSLSHQRQKDIMLSDRNILMDGYVCDIDVYCNNPETLQSSPYDAQLYRYYQEKINFSRQVYDYVSTLAMNGQLEYQLNKLYSICRDTITGKEYFKEKPFNNAILDVTVMQPLPMDIGDKLADRYGGKGVVSAIIPKDMMPILDNGVRVDIIKNQSTCINRENIGQLHEQSVTFCAMRIIDYIKENKLQPIEAAKLIIDFLMMIDEKQAMDLRIALDDLKDERKCAIFVAGVLQDGGIIMSIEPFTTSINLDTIRAIYDRFPWIEPFRVMVPIVDSNDNIRYVPTRRRLVAGKIYNFRLKQYAEEKFSATSLSATNLKNLNTRSKANKVYESKHTRTPIMFGPMESGNMSHIGMQFVVMNLMLYSSSPQARRLFEQLLTGDPYDVDVQLDHDSKNRNAEIINALMKAMGLRLHFYKTKKKKKYLCKKIMYRTIPNSEWKPKTNIREIIGNDDLMDLQYATAMQHKHGIHRICKKILYRRLDKNGQPIHKTNIAEILARYDREHGSDQLPAAGLSDASK